MKRKKFRWIDPISGKKHKLDVLPDFKRVLADVIETEEQAKSFFAAYKECSAEAEHNIGYIAALIPDKDVREDVLDLFMVEAQIEPRQLFKREYCLSETVRNGRS